VRVTLAPACAGRWEGRVLYLTLGPGGGVLGSQLRALARALQGARSGVGIVGRFALRVP
jgi:hypothetical protein